MAYITIFDTSIKYGIFISPGGFQFSKLAAVIFQWDER